MRRYFWGFNKGAKNPKEKQASVGKIFKEQENQRKQLQLLQQRITHS